MFTGLIEDLGTLRQLRRESDKVQLTVATRIPMAELVLGESIAVNGICLTVVAFGGGTFTADVSPESLACTTLGELGPGDPVNLERALRLGDRLGGHLVSGHVDGVAVLLEKSQDGNAVRLRFRMAAELNRLVVEKGSITIDGISLTVNQVSEETFSLAIIPQTLAATNLHHRHPGSRVNIETDIIGKYVSRLLGQRGDAKSSIDLDFLAKHGFL
ncbi:MAG: riboflavin synthase [Trichloromonadaceae bacterium]